MAATPRLLSIQSHTVHGFVGNKATTFPLQMYGFDVDAINTVTLSNHPAYLKVCKGSRLSIDEYKTLISGLTENNLLNYNVILSGYMTSPDLLREVAQTVRQVREVNPDVVYVLDSV